MLDLAFACVIYKPPLLTKSCGSCQFYVSRLLRSRFTYLHQQEDFWYSNLSSVEHQLCLAILCTIFGPGSNSDKQNCKQMPRAIANALHCICTLQRHSWVLSNR